jgi:transcriptional regulator with XRE-family HTH domain
MESIANRIKQHRVENELTQRQLAERMLRDGEDVVSLTRSIQRWEAGESAPRANQLLRISQELDVPVEDLLANGEAVV